MDLDYVHHHRANMESPEAKDTTFYAELTRQILVLIDEDDELTYATGKHRKGCESPEFQGRSVVSTCGNFLTWWDQGEKNLEVPRWMERLWASNGAETGTATETGTGTGVFIPRVVASGKTRRRRQNKARRNDGGRMHSYVGHKIHG